MVSRKRIGHPRSALSRLFDATNSPGHELAAGLFDGLRKVGIERRARPVWMGAGAAGEPLAGDPHGRTRAAGRRRQGAASRTNAQSAPAGRG